MKKCSKCALRSKKGMKGKCSSCKAKHKEPANGKMKIVMDEFAAKKLRSGSKNGPVVTNPKQAIAIGMSYGKKK